MEGQMFSTIRRIIGFGAIAIGLVIVGIDFINAHGNGHAFNAHSIGQDWQLYSKPTYIGFRGWLERTMPAKVAGYAEVALGLWTWAAVALAGVLIAPPRGQARPSG
jgi:hypothetical protein